MLARRADTSRKTGAGAGNPFAIAEFYGYVGNAGEVMRWLDAAYDDHAHLLPQIRSNPAFDTVRNDPRFRDLVVRLKLP